jgi:hypothetical protein
MIARTYTGLGKMSEYKISAEESLGQYEWKLHEPRFDGECHKFGDQRKQAILQLLPISVQII